ncbi:MAG TPA: long-chain fatty acid--CoA ligase, partial [Gemmatimonadota bacterium]|nr:long-chain fatty acid--CoA ligase [Gemmatimonadota bacterium]
PRVRPRLAPGMPRPVRRRGGEGAGALTGGPHGDVLGERARLTPEKTALVWDPTGERISYGELDRRAAAAAGAIRGELGLAKGDRYAVLSGNCVEFIELFFAAGKSGAVFVPLSTRLTPHELSTIAGDCAPSALFYGPEQRETVDALRSKAPIPTFVALGEKASPRDLSWSDLSVRQSPPRTPVERCAGEDPFCLLYTSGTTGRPKGAIVPHRMIAWNAINTALSWQLREDDVAPVYTPLYHAGGLTVFITPMAAIGGACVLMPGFDPAAVWQAIERHGCTVVLGVPTIFRMLREAPGFESADLTRVRWMISGGAPLPVFLIEEYRRRGVVLKQGFGMTEVGVNCFAMTSEEALGKAGSVGKPLLWTEARIAGEEGRELPPGEVGELWLRGPHVCSGYWNDPEETRQAFTADGWFRTGDLARRDADGFYFIAGRRKEIFISGGVNVSPLEVEAELLQHPQVADAAVVGIPDPHWGEVGAAFVVPRGGASLSSDELAKFLGERLARLKIPKRFELLSELPRTPYGKVVKAELKRRIVP